MDLTPPFAGLLPRPPQSALLRAAGWLTLLAALAGCVEDSTSEPVDGQPADSDVSADVGVDPDAARDADLRPPDVGPGERDADPGGEPDATPYVPCGNEDDLSPNHRPDEAARIDVGFTRDDLFLCPRAEDWYTVSLTAGQSITLQLRADPVDTDLDLALFDPSGALIEESLNEDGREQIDLVAPVDGDYQVRVVGYRDESAFYALSIVGGCRLDAQCPPSQVCGRAQQQCVPFERGACGVDEHEPNDRDDEAAPLAPGDALTQVEGRLCRNDRDWFRLEAAAGDTYELLVGFPAGEDVDVFVIDERGALIDSATGNAQVNPERLVLSHLAAGTYRIGLTHFVADGQPDRQIDWHMEIIGRSEPCSAARDCLNAGRPVCDDGLCLAVDAAGDVAPGGRCGRDDDCSADSQLCYTGGAGGHDNFCTVPCMDDATCALLGAGARCVPVTRRSAVCFPPCASDDDCSAFRRCDDMTRQCEIRGECGSDVDCGPDERCQSAAGARYCGLAPRPVSCGADAHEPNNRAEDAARVPLDGVPVEGLQICGGDSDWFQIEVPAESAAWRLSTGVSFEAGADLDVYVYTLSGSLVGEATSPDRTDEFAEIRYIAPGVYRVLVERFSAATLGDTPYRFIAEIAPNEDRCTLEGNECGSTTPLRALCDEETGACAPIEGNRALPLGALCDSHDDCGPDAELCWLFEGGQDGYNVCTRQCGNDAHCAAAPGTVCTRFQGAAVCLPPRG